MSTADRGARLGGDDYNHATDSEYKRLRAKADECYQKRSSLSQQSQAAFKSGDKSRAHDLSEESKKFLSQAEGYNRQAAEYVFRENNADSAGDEIDLHGLYVKEAEYILQNRLGAAIRSNQSHLRVIVGKGLHSSNGIAKLKPAIDQLCDECNLRHRIDPKNTGVMIIDLENAQTSQIPNHWTAGAPQQQQSQQPHYQQQQQPHYQQQQQQQHQQGGSSNDIKTGNQFVDLLLKAFCACISK
ncbi:hypothetical protein CAAN1_07S07162 [[Candida] anglica]|uniref:Smr domain-containing protein n=1 Tax=[Candida] anglica TaxID=148631 RepID=A0ABP0EG09_9ASCO